MGQGRVLALLAIIAGSIFWGMAFLSTKVTVEVIPPMTLGLARFIQAAVVLMLILKVVEPKTRLAWRDMPLMTLGGFVGVTAYLFFQNNGVKLISASTASLIIATIPILALLGEYLFFGVRLSALKAASVLISLAGVYLVVSVSQQNQGSLAGSLLMFGAALSWVAFNLITRPLSLKYSQLAVTAYQALTGMLTLIPFALLEHAQWQPVSGGVILHLLFLGLVCSALGYYLYVYALSKLGVSLVSLFINFIPIVTLIGAFVFLGEVVTLKQVAGGAIIILAVILASREDNETGPSQSQCSSIDDFVK